VRRRIHPDPAVGDHGGDGGMHPRTSRATTASAARSSRRHRLRRESPPLQYDRLDLVERSKEILPTDPVKIRRTLSGEYVVKTMTICKRCRKRGVNKPLCAATASAALPP
jgi:hypothetical protein